MQTLRRSLKLVEFAQQMGQSPLRDLRDNPRKYFAICGYTVMVDLSTSTKTGVQYNLWGGSVMSLGGKRHEHLLDAIERFEIPGCFALTELGHGSNVRGIETTATYDKASQEFVINTPSETSQKFWIGNAAKHGRMATVFCQLMLDGENKGVHAIIVPIRNEDGTPARGVRIADCGHKMGGNGIDNGRLWFDEVRVPRENLLNRFMDVTPEGTYVTEIEDPDLRFASMIGELVGGRLGISIGAIAQAKSGLTTAIRYSATRRQFGMPGEEEMLVLDFQSQQMRLLIPLAKTYAYHFACEKALNMYASRTPATMKDVHAVCAGLKSVTTWHKSDTLQVCRECCGGQGFSSHNKIGVMKSDSDVEQTYEGDNAVLLQQVTRLVLKIFKKKLRGKSKVDIFLDMSESELIPYFFDKNPLSRNLKSLEDFYDPAFFTRAFEYREFKLVVQLGQKLQHKIKSGKYANPLLAWNSCLDLIMEVGLAYMANFTLRCFLEQIRESTGGEKDTLRVLCCMYALDHMEENMGWFLKSGFLSRNKVETLHEAKMQLLPLMRPVAVQLCDAFDIPDHMLGSIISGDWVEGWSWKNTPEAKQTST